LGGVTFRSVPACPNLYGKPDGHPTHVCAISDFSLPYATLKAWSAGVRVPEADSMDKLQGVLRKRARLLERLAGDLEQLEA